MKKRVLSLLIVFAMIVSMVPVGTLAVNSGGNNEKDKIIYVSIGDSMTNGYGNDGYDGESGIANYAMQTYSNMFAAWLAGYDGEIIDDQVIFDGANAVVDHRQLAMSGMRAEDLHWLLELDHTDEEMIDKIVNSNGNRWDADLWYSYFKTGDRRTYGDLVSLDYRLADGAAKILATYADRNGSGYGYFMPSYGQDKIAVAVNGLKNDAY